MHSTIESFLIKHYGQTAVDSLTLLAESGSSRKYYRFYSAEIPFILTESKNVAENQTFLYFTQHFSNVMDCFPEIMEVSDDFLLYVQSDLGDESLMKLLMENPQKAKAMFEKSVIQLAQMQVLGDKDLDYSKCFSYPKFNYLLVLRDLFSFKNYYLNLVGIEFNHGELLKDFERLALDFEQIPEQYFVFRDFQSRNIMIHDGAPYFIDYQGGMKGPVQYDLVSLIWQAKANLSVEWKADLYALYQQEFARLKPEAFDPIQFKKGYELCLIERLLQVLGTYGFRGIYEKKTHFLESISFALQNLAMVKDLDILSQYPELQKVMKELALNKEKITENE